jgi:hypothetical protein
MASGPDDTTLRDALEAALRCGLPTEWRDRADHSEAVSHTIARLAAVAPGDHAALLRIAGFTPIPYVPPDPVGPAQACETCMYYARHRQFCDLPELRLPVRPDWSCRLWRI